MQTVVFRDFEERDVNFIYKIKNEEKINSMIVGDFHPFSYEDAVQWVHGCMGQHATYRYWAIASNDVERRIVGWMSLSQIDYKTRSACHHGIVIADSEYRDGSAYIEAGDYIYDYVFKKLDFVKLTGSCLKEHVFSRAAMEANYFVLEKIVEGGIYKSGVYHDVYHYYILRGEYYNHLNCGDFDYIKYIRRLGLAIKRIKKEIKE